MASDASRKAALTLMTGMDDRNESERSKPLRNGSENLAGPLPADAPWEPKAVRSGVNLGNAAQLGRGNALRSEERRVGTEC